MRARRFLPFLAALALLSPGCVPKEPPRLRPLVERAERIPVILLPGITGSKLRDVESGKVLWGKSRNFFWPRDGGYALALPITEDSPEDRIDSFAPVLGFRLLGLFRIEIYGVLIRLMEANGYRTGDLDDPDPRDTFFIFDYDWRYGNARAAGELARALERLRLARGEETLRVHFITHSNAGRIARWFVKYGGASLEEAETGRAGPPERIRVGKLILVGTDNGGALDTLSTLDRGRSYLPLLGRRFLPETVFTFESLFEALPADSDDLFFDEEGRPVRAPLFDAESWSRYGWSIFDPRVARRVRNRRREDLFGDEQARLDYLRRSLDRGRRMQRLLARDVEGFGGTRYYYLQNAYLPTGQRALLKKDRNGEWTTLYATDRALRRNAYLSTLAATAGDGYATVDSQLRVSPQERAAMAGPPVYIPARHRVIILHPAAQRWILEILAEP